MAGSDRTQERPPPNRVATLVLGVVLAGAPLLFGSRDPTMVATWCAVLGTGLLFASPRLLTRAHVALFAGVVAIVAGYAVVLHEQLAERPWFAPWHPIGAELADVFKTQVAPTVTVVRGEPFYALGAPLASVLALTLGLIVGSSASNARHMLWVVAWSGAGYAAYGFFSLLFDSTAILWRDKTDFIGNLTGTFINRNTAAAYFGSCSVVWLVLLMEKARAQRPSEPVALAAVGKRLVAHGPREREKLICLAMFFLCLVALFMTASRAGVLISLMVLPITVMLHFGRDVPHRKGKWLVFGLAIMIAIALFQIIGGMVSARFQGGQSDAARLSVYRATALMIADHPWFGTGLGTFAWAFPPYRSSDMSVMGVWDRAHSTPLELASELGIPLTVAIVLGWIGAFVVLTRRVLGTRRHSAPALAALAVALIAALHSCIDFSLQVTGYALVVFGLLGVGLAQAVQTMNGPQRPQRRRSGPSNTQA